MDIRTNLQNKVDRSYCSIAAAYPDLTPKSLRLGCYRPAVAFLNSDVISLRIQEGTMNWEAIGAIGEILGAVGVITTLLYLSVQIRQNTRQMRGEGVTAIAVITSTLTSELRDDPELLRIVLKAARDWHDPELSASEQARAHLFNYQEFQVLETAFHLMKEGLLDQDHYLVRENYTLRRLVEPGVQTWWKDVSYSLSEGFVERMNSRLDEVEGSSASAIPVYDKLVRGG
jgi:hypothetical protein